MPANKAAPMIHTQRLREGLVSVTLLLSFGPRPLARALASATLSSALPVLAGARSNSGSIAMFSSGVGMGREDTLSGNYYRMELKNEVHLSSALSFVQREN